VKKVYIAGRYSSNNVIEVFDNIRKGQRMATKVFLAGFAPFCPFLDFHYTLMLRRNESLTVEDYYKYSLAWLAVSDAILMLKGWQDSKGAVAEHQEAHRLDMPIFTDFGDLVAWQGRCYD